MFGYIKAALDNLKLVRDAAKFLADVGRPVASGTIEFGDIDPLAKAFFKEDLNEGQTVRVEGVLSRYSHFYNPRLFSNFLPGEVEFPQPLPQNTELRFVLERPLPKNYLIPKGIAVTCQESLNRRRIDIDKTVVNLRTPYLPIGVIPPFRETLLGQQRNFRLYFLYPRDSKGFVALPPLSFSQKEYHVPKDCQGIPVLVPENVDLAGYSESTCRLEAIIHKAPNVILDLLPNTNLYLRRELSTKFYRPESSTHKGFYLEAIKASPPLNPSVTANSFIGTIFIESHIQGMRFESIADLVQRYTLDNFELLQEEIKSGHSPGFMDCNGIYSIGMAKANILVKEPNYIAFYKTMDLRAFEEFENSYKYLRRLYDDFSEAVARLADAFRRKKGLKVPETRLSIDFLFDYDCQYDFSQSGVLHSPEIEKVIEQDKERRRVIDWLRLDEH